MTDGPDDQQPPPGGQPSGPAGHGDQPPPGWQQQQPPPGWQHQQPPPGPQAWGPRQETETLAIVALVLAIAAWFTCFVLAIVALILASKARDSIRASGGQKTGDNLVTAANWVAGVNLALVPLAILFFAGAFL